MSILLGFFRNDLSKYDISRDSFSYYYNQEIVVTGDIVETPVNKQNSQEVVVGNLNIIKSDNEIIPLNGKMLLQTRNFPEYYYGEVLQIEGEITEPISLGEFDYKSYLENQGIYGVVRFPYISIISENGGNIFLRVLFSFRLQIESNINRFFPEPEASLLSGIILGVQRNFPPYFKDNLQKTGTTHIVVVSGTNITLVMMIFIVFSPYLGRRRMLTFSLLGIFIYVFLVGFDPPVLRALIMFIPAYFSQIYGRDGDVFTNFIFAADVILFINPLLINNISFQLSFSATLGLILVFPILKQLIRLPDVIREGLLVSLSAQIMTLPIIVYNFKEYSTVSPLVNLLLIPIVPILTWGGFIFIPLSFLNGIITNIYSWFLYIPLTYFVKIVNFFGDFPGASISLQNISTSFVFFYYIALTFFIFLGRFFSKDSLLCIKK